MGNELGSQSTELNSLSEAISGLADQIQIMENQIVHGPGTNYQKLDVLRRCIQTCVGPWTEYVETRTSTRPDYAVVKTVHANLVANYIDLKQTPWKAFEAHNFLRNALASAELVFRSYLDDRRIPALAGVFSSDLQPSVTAAIPSPAPAHDSARIESLKKSEIVLAQTREILKAAGLPVEETGPFNKLREAITTTSKKAASVDALEQEITDLRATVERQERQRLVRNQSRENELLKLQQENTDLNARLEEEVVASSSKMDRNLQENLRLQLEIADGQLKIRSLEADLLKMTSASEEQNTRIMETSQLKSELVATKSKLESVMQENERLHLENGQQSRVLEPKLTEESTRNETVPESIEVPALASSGMEVVVRKSSRAKKL